jgi:hypothetical protein
MKNKRRIILVLMLFSLAKVFGQNSGDINNYLLWDIQRMLQTIPKDEKLLVRPRGRLVPLTIETVKALNPDKFKELQFYLSSDLTITTFSERKPYVDEGGVVRKNGGESHIITIPRTSIGECVEYKPDPKKNEDSFRIKFQEMELIFLRKTQINRFVLHFMVCRGGEVTNATAKMPYPYLCHFEYTEGEDFPPSPR